MCIHSSSLNEIIKNDREAINVLLECSNMEECSMLATPADVSVMSILNPRIIRISYEERSSGAFVAKYEEGWAGFHNNIRSSTITDLYGCKEDSIEFKKIKSALLDVLAFEAISRGYEGESIFVTQYSNLLEKNIWIQKRNDVKILSFVQTLEYFDLYLKKRNLYYANPHSRRVNGKAFHYWFLLKHLVPQFAKAWSISVFSEKVIQNGTNIKDVLSGLTDRFENALCPSDRIAMEYTKRPINSTEWEMLYNFNYFCLLVTGIFDLLAWLTVHRYSLPIPTELDRPHEVSIQITKPKSWGAKFVKIVSQSNPSLASFIKKNQDFIKLFYPMRHAVQHREPVRGAQFTDLDESWTASLAHIKQDALVAIRKIDQLGYPFTKWGLLNSSGFGYLLEPHRFTRNALRNLMAFANIYIELLDFPSLIAPHQDLIDKIAEVKSKEPEPPFLAKTYWKRDSHLPILFRNR